MLDVSIVNETSPEANWNRRADRQTGGQANLCVGRLRLQKPSTLRRGNNGGSRDPSSQKIFELTENF